MRPRVERPLPRQPAPSRISPSRSTTKGIQPERERPENIAGAVLRVALYPYHWLTAVSMVRSRLSTKDRGVFAPLKLDAGVNVGTYAPPIAWLRRAWCGRRRSRSWQAAPSSCISRPDAAM
jgi:hypothetical protein